MCPHGGLLTVLEPLWSRAANSGDALIYWSVGGSAIGNWSEDVLVEFLALDFFTIEELLDARV